MSLNDGNTDGFKAHVEESARLEAFRRNVIEAGLKSDSVEGVIKTGAAATKEAQNSISAQAEKAAAQRHEAGALPGPPGQLYVLDGGGTQRSPRLRVVNLGSQAIVVGGVSIAPGAIDTVVGSGQLRAMDDANLGDVVVVAGRSRGSYSPWYEFQTSSPPSLSQASMNQIWPSPSKSTVVASSTGRSAAATTADARSPAGLRGGPITTDGLRTPARRKAFTTVPSQPMGFAWNPQPWRGRGRWSRPGARH